jgi:hypothetical protein
MPSEHTGARQATARKGHQEACLRNPPSLGVLRISLVALALALPSSHAQNAGSQQPGAGASWYLYWMDDAKPGHFAFASDDKYQAMGSYATVWSRVYDPDKHTETCVMELYDASSGCVSCVSLFERNARGEVVRKMSERHPETKLTPADAKTREGALLSRLRDNATDMKSKEDARESLAEADKELRATAKQRPGGIEPVCWP